ncbi:MAG: F0F1 ATP synthase subunit A [Lachnospiraceae bacterium]|nr:F0F1 ATP synthase subunit A [Lachnospiraceae bacterium]MBQ4274973.1 F0F1 ATP synthase subunit A [Lachnospiraceae bacterium]
MMPHMLLANANGGVDFMIHGIFSYEIFGQEVWITTSHVCLLIVVICMLIFFFAAGQVFKHAKAVPGYLQCALEFAVEFLDGIVNGAMGEKGKGFRNYVGTLFLFILFSNISGLLGLRPPTADYGVTLPLGLITFSLIRINEVRYNNLWSIWKDKCSPLPPWLPIWLPINVIGDCAVPVSLSLRLFANVLSGTVMMALVYGLLAKIAIGWPAALHVYFDLFSGAIQTYVFCMLTVTYIGSAIGDNEETVLKRMIRRSKEKKAA